jgi:branched-chain amino acid transport system ATP-binding protein
MTAQASVLKATDLRVRYGAAQALFGVSLSLEPGSVLAIVGANGAGKSTIARALTGLVPLSSGSVVFDGQDVTGWPPHRIRRAGIVHLPEGRGVFRALTVTENLRMAAALLPRGQRKEAIERGMNVFPVLGERRKQQAGLMSGGEQQMVSLARALILSPKLVIADEMSLGLAPKMVDVVFEGLARARNAGVTIILIEQFIHRALAFADACVVLQRGAEVWSGPAGEAKDEILHRYLGGVA